MSRGIQFVASCCPSSSCKGLPSAVIKIGFSRPVTSNLCQKRQRYLCKRCKTSFSSNVFSLEYRCKHPDPALNSKIFSYHVHGLSNRSISRLLKISEHCARIRLHKMSLWAFDFHAQMISHIKIHEPICMDGLENFAGSQYNPNYINQAIGRDSLFIYDFNFSPLNRKGRMSKYQRGTLEAIARYQGRYNPRSIRISTVELLRRLYSKAATAKLTVISDEHFQYKRAIRQDLRDLPVEHVTISSKATRNYQNILFPVNHADLMIRQRIAAFSRETISFSKTHGRMCQRYILFAIHKNYMAPQFTKKLITRPTAHEKSPAEALGLTKKTLGYGDVFSAFSRLKSVGKACENPEWIHFREGKIPPHLQRSKEYSK